MPGSLARAARLSCSLKVRWDEWDFETAFEPGSGGGFTDAAGRRILGSFTGGDLARSLVHHVEETSMTKPPSEGEQIF